MVTSVLLEEVVSIKALRISFCICFIVCFCLLQFSVFASDVPDPVDDFIDVVDPSPSDPVDTLPSDAPVDDLILVGSEVKSVNPITPSNSSGLKKALVSVLGNYDAIVVEYQYANTSGYYSYVREIQPDYVWLCSAAILLVVMFCLFRFLGGIFHGRN